jgi:hypothetical protein
VVNLLGAFEQELFGGIKQLRIKISKMHTNTLRIAIKIIVF